MALTAKTHVQTNETKLRCKESGQVLNAYIPQLHDAVKVNMFLLTCTFLPEEATLDEAWELVIDRMDRILHIFSKEDDIIYAISTVEEHSASKKKKDEDEDDEDEFDDAKKKKKAKSANIKAAEKGAIAVLNAYGVEKPKKEKIKDNSYKFVYQVDPQSYSSEVMRVFKERDFALTAKPSSNLIETYERILLYVFQILIKSRVSQNDPIHKIFSNYLNDLQTNKKIPPIDQPWWKIIYDNLAKFGTIGTKHQTLEGYPHIHMAVACTSKSGSFRSLASIERLILDERIFKDVNAKTQGRAKKFSRDSSREALLESRYLNDAHIIGYTIKNSRYEPAFLRLGRSPALLHNLKSTPEVDLYYTKIVKDCPCIIGNITSPSIMVELKDLPEYKYTQRIIGNYTPISRPTPVNKTPSPDPNERMIQWVTFVMETNELYIGEDLAVYKKIPKSKMTWTLWGTVDDLWTLSADMEHVSLMLSQKGGFHTILSNGKQSIFPKIIMDFEWVEFKDFYIHLESGIVTYSQNLFPCFSYIDNYTYSDFYDVCTSNKKPPQWTSILENSGYIISGLPTERGLKFLQILFELFLARKHKRHIACIYGDPDARKSSLVAPITEMYPLNKITTMGKTNGFELSCLDSNLIVVMDEFTLQSYGITRETLLRLTEGDTLLPINKKHKDPVSKKSEARPIIMGNSIESWVYESQPTQSVQPYSSNIISSRQIDPAYSARMEFFRMVKYPTKPGETVESIISEKQKMCNEEKGLITLYLFFHYHNPRKTLRFYNDIDEIKRIVGMYKRERNNNIFEDILNPE
jgi:hypothetical protein